jgi:response regulator NasT
MNSTEPTSTSTSTSSNINPTPRGGHLGNTSNGSTSRHHDAWAPTHKLPLRPERILIAEDEHLVATELVLMLADLKYTIVGPAADGMSALQLAHKSLPDLALLDIRMPKKDGLAVAEQLYKELAIPTVILSAYADAEYLDAAKRGGVFAYLVKPVAEGQLRATLELAWQRYRDSMESQAEVADLRRRLEERRLVEQAKWKLVSDQKMAEPDALKAMQKLARDRRVSLAQIAQTVIDTGTLPKDVGPTA